MYVREFLGLEKNHKTPISRFLCFSYVHMVVDFLCVLVEHPKTFCLSVVKCIFLNTFLSDIFSKQVLGSSIFSLVCGPLENYDFVIVVKNAAK